MTTSSSFHRYLEDMAEGYARELLVRLNHDGLTPLAIRLAVNEAMRILVLAGARETGMFLEGNESWTSLDGIGLGREDAALRYDESGIYVTDSGDLAFMERGGGENE